MNKEFATIIKNFVGRYISVNSKYLWLTNLSGYGTMFKTNQLIENTVKNIVDILDNERFGDNIQSLKDICNCVEIVVVTDDKETKYFLFDYTQGVIESE